MNLLIELIFRGVVTSINFDFLKDFINGARNLYFNFPEINSAKTFDEIVEIFNENNYVDFAIGTDEFKVYDKNILRVFINLGRDDNDVELLFFFDLLDLNKPTVKESIDCLKDWTIEFKNNYKFDYYICQADNADEGEYYFDIQGPGRLYDMISR